MVVVVAAAWAWSSCALMGLDPTRPDAAAAAEDDARKAQAARNASLAGNDDKLLFLSMCTM